MAISVPFLWRYISIHAPREGSDQRSPFLHTPGALFLSTLPARGATGRICGTGLLEINFYPRSPRGERLPAGCHCQKDQAISIHAPREGSDSVSFRSVSASSHFYPRSPRGERPWRLSTTSTWLCSFLSTLPARGATQTFAGDPPALKISIHAPREGSDGRPGAGALRHGISIHAPREGSDSMSISFRSSAMAFLSTLPARGATDNGGNTNESYAISIHAPREGSDGQFSVCFSVKPFLSTLPARGATTASMASGFCTNFYPRSPRGERPPIFFSAFRLS